MTLSSTDTCSTCVDYPVEKAAEGDGTATCPWFHRVRAWNDRACVLYNRVPLRDFGTRKRWVMKLAEKHQKEGKTNG